MASFDRLIVSLLTLAAIAAIPAIAAPARPVVAQAQDNSLVSHMTDPLGALAPVAPTPVVPRAKVSSDPVAVPELAGRVIDRTGTLTQTEQNEIARTIRYFEERKGSQIAVLIVPTTQPETIEQFGIRVAEQWKLGRKGIDDGVILIVARNDHRLRIEVGRGLEGAIPDITAGRVIREVISPRFYAGDFYDGIADGVDRLIGLVDGEALPPPQPVRRASVKWDAPRILPYVFFGFFSLTFLIPMVGCMLAITVGRIAGPILCAAASGAIWWFALGIAKPGIFAELGGVFAGILGLLIGYLVRNAKSQSGPVHALGGSGSGDFAGSGGSSYASSSSDSSGGSSSDSGGGSGDFGGGGASGSW
jgi:uncharacterized protein